MDSLNGISDSILRHLILAYGSSHFAITAYRLEPTRNANSYEHFQLGKYPFQEGSKFGNRLRVRRPPTPLPISLLPLTTMHYGYP